MIELAQSELNDLVKKNEINEKKIISILYNNFFLHIYLYIFYSY